MTQPVRQIPVPFSVRGISSLSRIDYADAFVVTTAEAQGRTAEEWIRVMLEESPPPVQKGLRSGWLSLGLKLGSAESAERVLGWEVRQSEPDLVRLGLDSRLGMPAELLLERRSGSLLFCTFIRHGNSVLRQVWAAGIAKPHQRIVGRLLTRAVESPRASTLAEASTGVANS